MPWRHTQASHQTSTLPILPQALKKANTPYTSSPATGLHSRIPSRAASSTGVNFSASQRYFRSRRVKKEEIQKPWLDKKDHGGKWNNAIVLIGLFLGIALFGFLIYDGIRGVITHKYCPVLIEDFTSWNDQVWTKEVEVGGFGNGQFEETTNTDENVYLDNGVLVIRPSLQDQNLIENNNTIDLRDMGCTGTKWTECVATTNTTNGTIVNPAKSGRVNTKLGASIRFGRVEVTAQLPAGDWLWPAIWMLPTDNKYGEWPKSGEIDIAESRGNNWTYGQGGNNVVSSTLHFGPSKDNDGWWRNNVKHQTQHGTYSDDFNTFGVEWSERYVFTYINSRLMQVMYTHFNQPFWQYGKFPLSDSNGTRILDPWSYTGNDATPFDQDFYLILNVAVGGENGWFKDGKSGKPWVDGSPTARRDFWKARNSWYPTWSKQGFMKVKSVKMWQQEGYNGCNPQ
ncbi:concanavalin A-like lectin/glucanase [Lindgomyces ingoldianus]|uniref:Concanavalin A-like lectin/glucanase n=1 Tax=Lindgomyces ingoldianus TaxID=673940 RepID=A0ACB6QDF6_9PLEO|nr:concanavalin A-like lectin/glucanase [Lindgomyces ingoldianus]KAF2464880.1 concanavalin A-like lectin/glucanase [Lindgomyces ingoldianus]